MGMQKGKKRGIILIISVISAISIGVFFMLFIKGDGVGMSMNIWEEQQVKKNFSTQMNELATLRPNSFSGLQSSYDRLGGNNDGWGAGNFLETDDNGDKIMLDLQGSGVINRLWFAGAWDFDKSLINIYLDGEQTPQISVTLSQLVNSQREPFSMPMTANGSLTSGGGVSYIQIPFAKSAKITTNAVGTDFFYQTGYELYTDNLENKTWTPDYSYENIKNTMLAVGKDPKNAFGVQTQVKSEKHTIKATQAKDIFADKTGGEITAVKLDFAELKTKAQREAAISELWISVFYGGSNKADIHAPLATFFGIGNEGNGKAHSLMSGAGFDGQYYFYLPMPYKKAIRIVITNKSEENEYSPTCTIEYGKREIGENEGLLKGAYTEKDCIAYDGSDCILLDVRGTGHIVGIVQTFYGEMDRRYLEGDERIYIDDSNTPAWYGTGVEDLYNGSGYFWNGTFSLAFHGNPAHLIREKDITTVYRYFLTDPISFRKSIRFGMEHGADLLFAKPTQTSCNTSNVKIESLVLYYHIPQESMELTYYAMPQQDKTTAVVSTFAGNNEAMPEMKRVAYQSGESEFTAKINNENQGVLIRRTFDCLAPNQTAEVYADDRLAGVWKSHDGNEYHRFGEDEFILASQFTRGKDKINIRIKNIGESEWSEAEYRVYSFVNPQKSGSTKDLKPEPEKQWKEVETTGQVWLRENIEKHYVKDGKTVIKGLPGTILREDNSGENILLLNELPYENFKVSCKIKTPVKPSAEGEQTGIMLYSDDDNYIKVGRTFSSSGFLEFGAEQDGKFKAQLSDDLILQDAVWFSIIKIGDVFTAYCSTNGEKYTRICTFYNLPEFARKSLRLGLYSFGNTETEFEAVFDRISIEKSVF